MPAIHLLRALGSADLTAVSPVGVRSIDSKTGSVTFTDVQTVPAYAITVFDLTGSWDAQSLPTSGSSLGLCCESAKAGNRSM